jgi:hypothetical protein
VLVAGRSDIERVIWETFNFLVAHSAVTAFTRLPIGKLRDDPDLFGMYEATMREVTAVGRARGVRLPPDIVETQLAFVRSLPPDHIASMAVDLIHGNRNRVALAVRQGGGARPALRHPDPGEYLHLHRPEALHERRAGVATGAHLLAST